MGVDSMGGNPLTFPPQEIFNFDPIPQENYHKVHTYTTIQDVMQHTVVSHDIINA